MEALQDGTKRSGEKCDVERSNVEGSVVEGSDEVMIFFVVFHVEEELEELGRCLGCAALHLLVHPAHFCLVGVGVSLCMKRIGDHSHCAWDACFSL